MRRAAIVIGAVVVVAVVALVVRPFGPTAEEIDTVAVTRADLAVTVELAGSVVPRDDRTVGFGTGGTVAAVLVEDGDVVVAGTVLARLDDEVLAAQLAAAEAALASAEARLAADLAGPTAAQVAAARDPVRQAEAALAAARAGRADVVAQNDELVSAATDALEAAGTRLADDIAAGADPAVIALDEAAVDLAEAALGAATAIRDGAVAQADASVRAAETALAAARNAYAVRIAPAPDALIAADEAAVASATASVLAARATLGLTELRAPISGTIAAVGVRVGERVGAGTSVGGLSGGTGGTGGIGGLGATGTTAAGTIRIIDLTSLRVDASASEIDVVSLALDQPVVVTLDALPDLRLDGHVCELATIGRSDGGVVAFPVTVCLQATDDRLRIGMSANVSIVLASVEDALVLPAGSIRTVDGRATVDLVAEDGEVSTIEVGLGISNGTRTEILDGLVEGQRVALRPTGSAGSAGD